MVKLVAKLKRLKIVLKNWNKTVQFGRVEQQLQQLEDSIVDLEVDHLINKRMELEKSLLQEEILIKTGGPREVAKEKRDAVSSCYSSAKEKESHDLANFPRWW